MLHFRMDMPFFYMALYGSVMIVAVLLLRALLKNKLPKFVFPVLWGLVLLRLLVPFSLSSPLSLPVPSNPFSWNLAFNNALSQVLVADWEQSTENMTAGTPQSGGTAVSPGSQIGTVSEAAETVVNAEDAGYGEHGLGLSGFFRSQNLLSAVYFLGLAIVAAVLGWQKVCYTRKLRESLLIEHNETVNAMLREMGMGHVLVFTNDQIASPLVSGLLNPRIYLPTRMDFGNTVLLRHVLAHETMHVRHRDNWLKCVMLAALVLHWFNPLVWVMAKCLASDLEAACDGAVLKKYDADERKSYAFSLLAMAISGSRATLLYSAFSKTEVEKRVKGVLNYRKVTVFALLVSVLFLAGSTAVFATGGQAPFSAYLTSFCYSSDSSWGARATLARDIALGENARNRADNAVLAVLREDATGDPEVLEEAIRAALAGEFGVEKSAFEIKLSLVRDEEELDKEYEPWGLTRGKDGFWLYQGEQIRVYEDGMLGSYQSHDKGAVDVSVQRDRLGNITGVTVWRPGDQEYDQRTRIDTWNRSSVSGEAQTGDGIVEETAYEL